MKLRAHLLFGLLPLLACSTGNGPECRVGAECASGACDSSGRCVPAPAVDASTPDAGASDTSAPDTSTPDAPSADVAIDSPVPGCHPTGNGVITRAEIPLQAGLHATFRIAANVTWNTAGVTQSDGTRLWDLSTALTGDHDVRVDLSAVTGTWYAPEFTAATYATKLADSSDLLGVFQVTDPSLLLLGVVSPANTGSYTDVKYSPAVTTLAFPLQANATWQTNSTVTGMSSGIPNVTYFESYSSKVDATGTLKTPYATFPVLRVHTVLTRTVGALVTVVRSDAFVTECFGPVATVTSQNNELNDEFTSAAEVRRLAP